jgi:hypothetical protein
VAPYLTLFSRGGISREAADGAVEKLSIHELPAARNCTYVLPASDFALGLTVGATFAGAELSVAAKLGVTEREVSKLCDAVRKALENGALTPDEIRDAVGPAARSLGEEGTKKGISTTLPLALGKLQAEGEIRRLSTNGRLDNQRYKYALWRPNPLARFKLSLDEAMAELAKRFFAWIGPETLTNFQQFSALGVKASKEAVASLKLVPVADGDERLMLPQDREALEEFKEPKDAQYVLVSSLDGIVLFGPAMKGVLDVADQSRELFIEKDTKPGGSLTYAPSHMILDRGRLIGLWEFDTETNSIAWTSFVKRNKELENAVARTQEYVRTQLGDARSFALDSPKSRAPRIAYLRKQG